MHRNARGARTQHNCTRAHENPGDSRSLQGWKCSANGSRRATHTNKQSADANLWRPVCNSGDATSRAPPDPMSLCDAGDLGAPRTSIGPGGYPPAAARAWRRCTRRAPRRNKCPNRGRMTKPDTASGLPPQRSRIARSMGDSASVHDHPFPDTTGMRTHAPRLCARTSPPP